MKLFTYVVETTVSQTLFTVNRKTCLYKHRRAIAERFYIIGVGNDTTKELTIDTDEMDTDFHHDTDTVTLRTKVCVTIERKRKMNKTDHGIANFEKYAENRSRYFHEEKTEPVLGGVFFIPQCVLGMEYEGDVPVFLPFMVTKIYPHVILIQRQTKKHGVHTQAISKWNFRHYAEEVSEEQCLKWTKQFYGLSVEI